MADIASLSLEVKSDQVKQATAALRELPQAASAAERAAQKWGTSTDAASRSADDFSKRVQRSIADLEFQRQQLARTATEQERFTALRRAGVSAASAEGQAISASVAALQAQKAALGQTTLGAKAYGEALSRIKSLLTAQAIIEIATRLLEMTKEAVAAVAGLDELAEQVGISTRALQGLQFVAVQNGVSLDELNTAVSKFSQKIGEAAAGSKPMIDSLDALGVKILDAQGHLRPTEDLLQSVAQAILKIEDPAKRAAASVDFFGKAGTKFLPVLAEIAKGTEATALAADAFGAMVGDVVVKRLDAFADAGDRAALRTRNWLGTFAAYVLLGADAFAASFSKLTAIVGNWLSDMTGITSVGDAFTSLGKKLTAFVDESAVEGARWSAMFLESFASLPVMLGKLFVDAWNAAKVASAEGLNALTAWLADKAPAWMGLTGTNAQASITPTGGGLSSSDVGERARAAGQAAADRMLQLQQQAALGSTLAAQGGLQARGAARGTFGTPATTGASNPAPKASGGETPEQKYAALEKQLQNTAAAQDKMTAAAAAGDQAFEAQKATVDAQNKVLEIFKTQLAGTDPRLTKIRDLLLDISKGKAAEAFSVATTELQKQNVILEAQIGLMNEAPEVRAREIALIKARVEAEKAGLSTEGEAFDARVKAIQQNVTLTQQQEELKKAQELWTAPLKQALQDIQSTAADAFEQILTSGNFSFQSLGDAFKKIITRMAAEFLALATIRPVMSVVLNAVSPDMARQMGLSTSGGGALGGNSLGGLGSLFDNGSSLSKMWQQTTDFFSGSSAFSRGGISDVGAGMFGPAGDTAISGGLFGSGISAMGALGAGAGIFGGAMGLLGGGQKSTASTIGSIGQMVGGAVSLIPGVGQIAGPAIMLLSSLLPSLFGGTPQPVNSYGTGGLNYGSGGYMTSGSTYGANAENMDTTGPLGAAGKSIQGIFDLLGGVKDASKAYGIQLASFNQQYADGSSFSNKTSSIINPDGSRKQWGMGSTDADVGLDTASAEVAIESVLNGAVGKITDNMRKALNDLNNAGGPATLEQIQTTVTEVKAFDDALAGFGHTTTDAESQIQQIDASFQGLYDTATKYNLAASETIKIDQEKTRQELEATKVFSDSIADQITAITDPVKAQMDAVAKAQAKDLETNATYVKMVAGYADQSLNIEQLYQLQRQKIMDDANAKAVQAAKDMVAAITSSVSSIQDLIRQLTPGGDLANVDPRTQLAGLRATYNASFAQAIADPSNAALITKAVSDAQALAETSLRFNAGSADYERDRQIILQQQQALQEAAAQQGIGQSSDPEVKNLLSQLLAAVSKSTANNDNAAQRDADMAVVINLLTRYLANGRTAA